MNIALVFCKIDDLFDNCKAGVFSIFESNPPLGLASIGTVAKSEGHKVKVFDQLLKKFSNQELIEAVMDFHPDMVGFACTSLNITNSCQCATIIKKEYNLIVFAGGIHITLCTKNVLDKNIFDFLISGEGEEVFRKFLVHYKKEKNICCRTLGFWHKDTKENCGIAVLEDVNNRIVDRQIIDIDEYRNIGALLEEFPCYSLFSSRGCPFKCRFCSKPEYFKVYRRRSTEDVMKEIHELVEVYGAKAISFREDNFTCNISELKEFCNDMIKNFGGDLHWECESRADMPRELLELMYAAGCRGIWCGVETTIPRWNRWINKQLTLNAVNRFYKDCADIGIKTGALFMFGFPDETDEEIDEDVHFANSLPTVFSAFQCLAIFPGSPLAEYYDEHPELKHRLTDGISLALRKGYEWTDMLRQEKEINNRIKSVREQKSYGN